MAEWLHTLSMRFISFSEWLQAREEVSLAYGGGMDPVGMDTHNPNRFAGIKSKYHTFDGDEDAQENLGKKRKKGPHDTKDVADDFGFKKDDPILKIQTKPGGIGRKDHRR